MNIIFTSTQPNISIGRYSWPVVGHELTIDTARLGTEDRSGIEAAFKRGHLTSNPTLIAGSIRATEEDASEDVLGPEVRVSGDGSLIGVDVGSASIGAVRYNGAQALTDPQKEQARANIGLSGVTSTNVVKAVTDPVIGMIKFSAGSSELNIDQQAIGFDPRKFGAKLDGVNDDGPAIMAADAVAIAVGGYVALPAGTLWASQIVVNTRSRLYGKGLGTVIKQLPGSNKDLIYGINSNACWGNSTPTGFATQVELRDFVVDGNRANNTSGSGIAIFGPHPRLRNIYVRDCADYGIRTGYIDEAVGNGKFSMEGRYENIVIDTTGKHGWHYDGPHDSNVSGLIVIDASQSGAGQYDAIYCDLNSTSRWSQIHTWARGSSAHPRSGINLVGGGHEFSNAHFEAGVTASAWIQSSKNSFDASCSVFAPWNGCCLLLTGSAPANTYLGKITGHPSGWPQGVPYAVGIKLGASAGDYVHNCVIRAYVEGMNLGAIDFTYSGGENTIELTSYQTSGPGFIGTPAKTDYVDLKQSGGTIGVARYMSGGTPTQIKPVLSIGTAANNGWYRLGQLVGAQSQTQEIRIVGTNGYSPTSHSHGETVAFLRLENDNAWRGTFMGIANPSTTPVTAMVADSSGYVYAQIGQFAQLDVIPSGSARFIPDGTFVGASTPTGNALETTYSLKVAGANALTFQEDGTPQFYNPVQFKSQTVAQLNALTNKSFGMIAFAGNGRKLGELAGNGTGCPVYYGGTNWLTFHDNTTVRS